MNHIQAFFVYPFYEVDSPTKLYSISVIALLPTTYWCKLDEVQATGLDKREISKIKPFLPIYQSPTEKIVIGIILALLFIPSVIIGTILRGISYLQPDVREFHRKIVAFKENSLQPA